MNSLGKTAGLSFLVICAFIFIPTLSAQEGQGGPPPVGDELILIYEELLLDEEYLHSEDFFTLQGDFTHIDEEVIVDNEAAIADDFYFDDEDLYFLSEDDFLFDGPTIVIEASPVYENRSFDDVFPGFSQYQKAMVFSDGGLRHSFGKDEPPMLIPDPGSGIDLLSGIMSKNHSHIIEALVVVPYHKRELDMLDVYNALGRIEDLQNHTVPISGNQVKIFAETTRIESARNRRPISDPPPKDMLPFSETMYLRFKDTYMGDLYLRGELSVSLYGITYSMTNFTDIRYFIIPVMRAERYSTMIYLEPVKEGILIYSMSGLYLPGFIADRINLTTNINRRIAVLLSWITDGLRRQESMVAEF